MCPLLVSSIWSYLAVLDGGPLSPKQMNMKRLRQSIDNNGRSPAMVLDWEEGDTLQIQ